MKSQVRKVDIYILGDYYYSAYWTRSLPKLKTHLLELWSRGDDLNNNVEQWAVKHPASLILKYNKGV